ncbi:MAG: YggS family pyridoxal phosphate-dependent enzyme [Phycisphaerae bacterium]|nr:YggS family pyridoxal phosphate-dependent enzyme [Phycisphaerae bacterium]
MAVTRKRIEKNLGEIRQRIAEACAKSSRNPKDVTIVAVTKSVDLDTIKNLLDAGVTELGENRIQQLVLRAGELNAYLQRRRNELPRPVRWHMVGHLQRNKVKGALEWTSMIHSVDSLRLAEELSHRAEQMHRTMDVLLQVNCSRESRKFGCAVGASEHLAELITTLPRIRLAGLMTMGPMTEDPEPSRAAFRRLRELFEDMKKNRVGGDSFRHLSMGMSIDYPQAVEEGATLVRIGTALFA